MKVALAPGSIHVRAALGMGVVEKTPKCSTQLVVDVEGRDAAEQVHHALVVEEDDPAERVHPGFLRGGPDGLPVLLAERGHQGGVDGPLAQLAQQDLHLARGPAGGHLAPEAELAVARGVLELRVLAEVLEDFLVHLVLPDALLVEVVRPAVDRERLGDEELLGARPLGGSLEHGLGARAVGGQERGGGQPEGGAGQSAHASPHYIYPGPSTPQIRADSSTIPRSMTRDARLSRPARAGWTSGDSASWRSTSMSRRRARIRSPSCPPPAGKRSSTSPTRRNACQYALRKASSISRFWASWRSTPSRPFQACSHRLCEPHGQRWHSIAARAPSGPWLFSRSIMSGTDRRAICSVSPRVRCSQSRGTCRGGVCQNTRFTLPSFICTVPPWATSTWMRSRWRRRSTPTMSPRLAPPFRRTRVRRPGSASAAARPRRPPRPRAIRATSTSERTSR